MKEKLIKCPKCKNGTLEKLSENELQKLIKELPQNHKFFGIDIYGCDECKFWVEGDFLE